LPTNFPVVVVAQIRNIHIQKLSTLPPTQLKKDRNSLGARGSRRPKNIKECIKLDWNFQRGRGVFSYTYTYTLHAKRLIKKHGLTV